MVRSDLCLRFRVISRRLSSRNLKIVFRSECSATTPRVSSVPRARGMLRGVLVAQLLQAATTQSRVRPSACFRRAGFVIASFPSRSRSPSPFRVSSVRFVSQPNPAVFPACGRNSTARASSTEHEMSLPKGEGADALVAQSCADLGACSRYGLLAFSGIRYI